MTCFSQGIAKLGSGTPEAGQTTIAESKICATSPWEEEPPSPPNLGTRGLSPADHWARPAGSGPCPKHCSLTPLTPAHVCSVRGRCGERKGSRQRSQLKVQSHSPSVSSFSVPLVLLALLWSLRRPVPGDPLAAQSASPRKLPMFSSLFVARLPQTQIPPAAPRR